MHYLLTPLESHFDKGFGAVANSFLYAADLVAAPDSPSPSLDSHIPSSFLYRHAIELYLKSGIIIFHRKFAIPWGPDSKTDEPHVLIGGKWKPMYNEHKMAPLYGRVKQLMVDHIDFLRAETRTTWDFPKRFDDWISLIDETDSSSTFFRYPITKHGERDAEKSSMKPEDFKTTVARMGAGSEPQKMFVVLDSDGNVSNSFRLDKSKSLAILKTLQETANYLYGCHAAMRVELTGGW